MGIKSFVGIDPGIIDYDITKYFYEYKKYHPWLKQEA